MEEFGNYRNGQGEYKCANQSIRDEITAKMRAQGLRQVERRPLPTMTYFVYEKLDDEFSPPKIQYMIEWRGY